VAGPAGSDIRNVVAMLAKPVLLARAVTALTLAGAGARVLDAQPVLDGRWRGYWTRAGDTLSVDLTIRRDTVSGRYVAAFSSERLRVSGIPFADVRVTPEGGVVMTLRGDRTTSVFRGRVQRDTLAGMLEEGGADGRFLYVRGPADARALREREVTFQSGGVRLAGTLLLPADRPSAAVVFLHGSGAEGRWASRYLAEALAARGVAALIFDKRGVGGSTGDWRGATPEDLMRDAHAAVEFLASAPELARVPVGVLGHSQGGTLAPMLAARSPTVRFVVASAAAGVPTDSTEIFSLRNSVLPGARTRADSADAERYVGELVAVAYHGVPRARLDSLAAALGGRPWFFAPPPPDAPYWTFSRSFGAYQAAAWWAMVRVPVLLLYGDADQRVPARESAARIAAVLLRSGDGEVTARVFPGADHTFRLPPGPSGWPRSAPGFITAVTDWVTRRR
jgi:uncharacterized protein